MRFVSEIKFLGLAGLLSAAVLAGGAAMAKDAEGHEVHLDNAHDYRFCEIHLIKGRPPNVVAEVYNSSGVGDCPADKFDALNAEAMAKQYHVDAVFLNPPRYWMMDQLWLYNAGETKDFDGVQATWMATLPLRGALAKLGAHGSKRFPSYKAAEIQRSSKYLYRQGSTVFLIHQPDKKTWIMQAYTKTVDPSLDVSALPDLGSKLKNLPAGWRFEAKTLDKDLTVSPPASSGHMAHVLSDELDNVYEGCGFDSACSYLP